MNNKTLLSEEDLKNANIEETLSKKEAHLYEQEEPPKKVEQPRPQYNEPTSMDWKNVKMQERLASQGLFYTDDTIIQIKPAQFSDIINFSNMDEEDFTDKEARINKLFERCLRITRGGRPVTTKELVTKDKLSIILSIRDYTFSEFPNELIASCNCPKCRVSNKVPLYSYNTVFYEPSEFFQNNYNPNTRSVQIISSKGDVIDFYFPKIGTEETIARYINNRLKNGRKVDYDMLNIVLHTLSDWQVTDSYIDERLIEIHSWTLEMFTLFTKTMEDYKKSSKAVVIFNCTHCGAEEVSAQYTFPGEFRHIFLIQSIIN